MVGVPGRSRGCLQCRQRRIKCGQETPSCAQCIRSKRSCPGYRRDRIFITTLKDDFNTRRACAYSSAYTPTCASAKNSSPKASECQPNFDSLITVSEKLSISSQASPITNVSLTLSATRDQLYSMFLACYIPSSHYTGMPWVTVIPSVPDKTAALETASMALCTARLGRVFGDKTLLNQSLQYYHKALVELQKSLWDPIVMQKDDTLGASMALATYEVMECPTQSCIGYLSHIEGLAKLVKMRGPSAHQDGLGHAVFSAFRFIAILQAIGLGRNTFLAESDWLTSPWEVHEKDALAKLLDIVVQAPKVVEDSQDLGNLDPTEALSKSLCLSRRCFEFDLELQRFYQDLERNTSGLLYWPQCVEIDEVDVDQDSRDVDSITFQFPNLAMAQLLMFYWSTLTRLWRGLNDLNDLFVQLSQSMNFCHASDEAKFGVSNIHNTDNMSRPPSLESRKDFGCMVRNICRSVKYCTGPEMLGVGPLLAIAPLSMALGSINDQSQYQTEACWIEQTLERLCSENVRYGKTVNNFCFPMRPDMIALSDSSSS